MLTPCISLQIRLEPLTGPIRSNYYDIRRNQLFNFGVPQEHKLHSGSYRIYSLVSNQPLGIQPILGRRHENPVAGPADPWMHPPPDPVIVPVPNATPQTFTVQQVKGSEDTYLITIEGRYTQDDGNVVYALQGPPVQEWAITYWQEQNAYTIVKLNTDQAWTHPSQDGSDDRHDPGDSHQICLKPLTGAHRGTLYEINPNQLFRFEVPREHKLLSGNYRIHSLVSNQSLGIQPIMGRRPENPVVGPIHLQPNTTAGPVVVPVPSAFPQIFSVQRVKGSEDAYLITIQDKYTLDDGNVVYALQGPPVQEWVITYRQEQNAYTIGKLNTDQAWTDHGQHGRDGRLDPDNPRQIRLEPLIGMNPGDYSNVYLNQLFRFEAPRPHDLPSGNHGNHFFVSNQPGDPVVKPAHLQTHSIADPVVAPAPSVTPQTFTVQQANGSQNTCIITIQSKYTPNEQNLIHAPQSPPAQEWVITHSIGQAAAPPTTACAKHQVTVKLQFL
ncbi:hypothetical protein EDC04DRAFT_2209399 [Pisolithus marmoratus]|nr:hypothetical protein EDC04DRAFT_2209399 [Pisolithus marmoratus]